MVTSPVASAKTEKELAYLYASNANVSNFVSVRLSGDRNYHLWKTQMLCLLKAHDMRDLVEDSPTPTHSSSKMKEKYDSLLKGWIFGSLSEDVLSIVVNSDSAKSVWTELKKYFGSDQQASKKVDTKVNIKDKNVIFAETGTNEDKGTNSKESKEIDGETTQIETQGKDIIIKYLRRTYAGSTLAKASAMLLCDSFLLSKLANMHTSLLLNKNTLKYFRVEGLPTLHFAVKINQNDFVRRLLWHMGDDDDFTEIKNLNGSTVLHIAAIVGNTYAAELLLKYNKRLLDIEDNQGKTPLDKAYEHRRLDTTIFLLNAAHGYQRRSKLKSNNIDGDKNSKNDVTDDQISKSCVRDANDFLVLAISAKRYDLAKKIVDQNSEYDVSNDEVLMAIVSNFPSGLDYVEALFYPSKFLRIMYTCIGFPGTKPICFFLAVPVIKSIELKKKEYEEAKKVLELVCQKIKHPADDSSSRKLYSRPILEAACQDAYDVVDEILRKWPKAIQCKDKNGYDTIQLATIHRSEKIYNLVYRFREDNDSVYGTMEDSSENNMLHLAGRLAPLNELKRHTGAALQLQSELQWHQEVEKIMFPTYVTKKNIFGETPEMVFTREHEYLVKEGEKWIKAVAESCSITAALIITIVFAAAITVPGGSSQNGVPVFTNETAFVVFALSDAISLFSSVTALLVFLSILTSRFSEQDFLDRLPGRLFIGLCTLLVSTTAMIVAFGATLFLVFCHQKLWMIAPICGLAFLPIAIFFILQFPLIVDLFRSTYISRFGKTKLQTGKLNANAIKSSIISK
ncbi:hypothetical protein E3N88_26563 [Mikania micrantha]|uniref:PGG domain-containing protein n=1 Tax=Mikania micrantha TaxID=192012 RepID=A0A5N6MX75_9ASTR|nr:hypothetical protein E3N88_26563 [Mikania micrantha]